MEDDLDTEDFLKRTQKGHLSFDAYVEILFKEIQKCNLDLYKSKANAFLKKNVGISYEDFLRQAKPEEITEMMYGKINPQDRKDLFARKTSLYLSALYDVEEKGYDVKEVLDELEEMKILELKKIIAKIASDKTKTEPETLQSQLCNSDFEMQKYHDEFGIDSSRIRRYRTNEKGETILLCSVENNFYVIKISPKTRNWKKTVSEYTK